MGSFVGVPWGHTSSSANVACEVLNLTSHICAASAHYAITDHNTDNKESKVADATWQVGRGRLAYDNFVIKDKGMSCATEKPDMVWNSP